MRTDTAGKTANTRGKNFELTISHQLRINNYVELNPIAKMLFIDGSLMPPHEKWFTEQAPVCENIYGVKWKIDLVLYHREKFPELLLIECKWQSVGGSVDEKFPFVVASLKKTNKPSILITAGGGARDTAITWVKNQQVKGFTHMSLDQFILWAQKSL